MDAAVLVRGRLFLENVKITDLQLVVFVGMISDAQVNSVVVETIVNDSFAEIKQHLITAINGEPVE